MLIVGAGVHGMSTAWHLAEQGEEMLVVDKADVAATASGIACGVVCNNCFQPGMHKHSVRGGASPLPKGEEFEVDPYPTWAVEPGFPGQT